MSWPHHMATKMAMAMAFAMAIIDYGATTKEGGGQVPDGMAGLVSWIRWSHRGRIEWRAFILDYKP